MFSELTDNILRMRLAHEVFTAFFVEASALGVMLFGRKRHFASTCMMAIGTLISAFWILAADGWMHAGMTKEARNALTKASRSTALQPQAQAMLRKLDDA